MKMLRIESGERQMKQKRTRSFIRKIKRREQHRLQSDERFRSGSCRPEKPWAAFIRSDCDPVKQHIHCAMTAGDALQAGTYRIDLLTVPGRDESEMKMLRPDPANIQSTVRSPERIGSIPERQIHRQPDKNPFSRHLRYPQETALSRCRQKAAPHLLRDR